jgi:hypothetical protein
MIGVHRRRRMRVGCHLFGEASTLLGSVRCVNCPKVEIVESFRHPMKSRWRGAPDNFCELLCVLSGALRGPQVCFRKDGKVERHDGWSHSKRRSSVTCRAADFDRAT